MQFNELSIMEPILRALEDKNYSEPTAIQERSIPLILEGKDIMGSAQTGTGKTAAFAIPIIQMITEQKDFGKKGKPVIQSLIVTPTRELAIQIEENIEAYSKYTRVRHAVIYGGVAQGPQVDKLRRGVHILVATPGRLLDLIDQGFISIREISMFVLDEADRMLDMGFIHDIRKIIKLLPHERQSLFFSATMPSSVLEISRKILKNPVKIAVSPTSATADTVNQYLYYTNRSDKKNLLLHILQNEDINQVLIFSRTKHGADRIVKDLVKKKQKASAIHGNKSQNQRQTALSQFKEGKIRILVATDIAARGIDIDKLKYVINYDIPNIAETYVHRIGRSGRAGEEGNAISICEPEENQYVSEIEKLIKQKISVMQENPFPQTEKPMNSQEKKAWEQEKQQRKRDFFANRKSGQRGGYSSRSGSRDANRSESQKPGYGRKKSGAGSSHGPKSDGGTSSGRTRRYAKR